MAPMAVPILGGMLIELLTLFVVPVLWCWTEELGFARTRRAQKQSQRLAGLARRQPSVRVRAGDSGSSFVPTASQDRAEDPDSASSTDPSNDEQDTT